MTHSIDWGKLVSQGRAKAHGISWSDEEAKAITLIAQTLGKSRGEVAHYVREGILTVEDYQKAVAEKKSIINPFLKLSKEELLKKALAMKIEVSPDIEKEVLADAILNEKKKIDAVAKAKKDETVKAKAKADAKNKAEAEAEAKKAKAKKEAEAKAKAKTKK